ncbi:hypothetical protein D9M72_422670 [compost metagenome]
MAIVDAHPPCSDRSSSFNRCPDVSDRPRKFGEGRFKAASERTGGRSATLGIRIYGAMQPDPKKLEEPIRASSTATMSGYYSRLVQAELPFQFPAASNWSTSSSSIPATASFTGLTFAKAVGLPPTTNSDSRRHSSYPRRSITLPAGLTSR